MLIAWQKSLPLGDEWRSGRGDGDGEAETESLRRVEKESILNAERERVRSQVSDGQVTTGGDEKSRRVAERAEVCRRESGKTEERRSKIKGKDGGVRISQEKVTVKL